jgi:transcription elongation factor Elf1
LREICPFCQNELKIANSEGTLANCHNCDANYYKIENYSSTDVEAFNTNQYSVQIYKNKNVKATKISSIENEDEIIAWADEELKISNYSFESINNKISKIITFS